MFWIQIRAVRTDVTERLQQRFRPLLHVDHLAFGVEPETQGGLFIAGVIERQLVVEDHLGGRIEFLDLYGRRHGCPGGCLKMRDIDGILTGHDTSYGDDLFQSARESSCR